MKINGVEIQGIRRVCIEDLQSGIVKTWVRVPTGDSFVWDYKLNGEYHQRQRPDVEMVRFIRFAFANQHLYSGVRIYGITVHVKLGGNS